MTFWKRLNCEDSEKIGGCQRLGEGERTELVEQQIIFRVMKYSV